MSWQTLMINKELTKNEIKNILSQLFHIDIDKIDIYKKVDELAEMNEDILIFCISSIAKTDYFLRLDIYVDDKIKIEDDLIKVKNFCKLANCDSLFDDGTENPYTWLLVHKTGIIEQISIDIDKYDDANEYELK